MTPRLLKAFFAVTLALGALGMPAGALASNDRAPAIVTARLSTSAIKTLLRSRGYTKIGRIRLTGAVYRVVARDSRGRRVELVIDPQSARIIRKILIRD